MRCEKADRLVWQPPPYFWVTGSGAKSHRAQAFNQPMFKMPSHSSESDDRGGPKKNACLGS